MSEDQRLLLWQIAMDCVRWSVDMRMIYHPHTLDGVRIEQDKIEFLAIHKLIRFENCGRVEITPKGRELL